MTSEPAVDGSIAPVSPPVVVVGVVGGELFGAAAREALDGADVVVGAPRHLADLGLADGAAAAGREGTARPGRPGQEVVELRGPIDDVVADVVRRRAAGSAVVVLASGDPGFFGIVRALSVPLGADGLRVHPAPSSVALAFARAGTSWDDAVVVSAHGRPLEPAVAAVAAAPKAAVLTDPVNTPQRLGAALAERQVERSVVVVSRIGEPSDTTNPAGEQITRTDVPGLAAGSFDPLSVVVLTSAPGGTAASEVQTVTWGRAEDAFDHRDGMITKAEVRAVALGKLALPATGVLWDVGAGSGSVGIEAALVAPGLEVWAVERDPSDVARIEANARRHDAAVRVVAGEAPVALADLPDPDRVFLGGGGIDVLDACLERLRPGGVVVACFVVLDRALAAHARLGNMVQVRVDRCVPIGGVGLRMEPLNPVFVAWGSR